LAKKDTVRAARAAAQRLANEMEYELVDVELATEHDASFLRIYVDLPEGMSLEACEKYHRRLMPLVQDLEYDYLEVSSPGADRPLKTERDFVRAKDLQVEVRLYKAVDGVKKLQGRLIGLVDGKVCIETDKGTMQFEQSACALVRPLIEDVQDITEGE